MLDSNYLIMDRKPQRFSTMRIAGKTVIFLDSDGKPLNYGVFSLDESIYAALYCDEVRNVTLVRDKDGVQTVITMLWLTEEGYRDGIKTLEAVLEMRFSEQNTRINRYAEAIAEKLALGVRLRVADAVDESEMAVCPECGTLNPPGSMYCMDCGAEMP